MYIYITERFTLKHKIVLLERRNMGLTVLSHY